ncbi:Fe-S cluster assembly protein SufD [Gorillibacterium sp. sgz500922]|uniref:Fe-S cluster assembly protein SufD n=1 Tax=Gorillibacterium sp. sgz500922 TaxID=3446694 RepID=UPI003F67BBB4
MTSQTLLPVDRQAVSDRSRGAGEPEWLTASRLEALALAGELELPRLEKTRIDRWNWSSIGLPADIKQTLAAAELSALLPSEEHRANAIVQKGSATVHRELAAEWKNLGVIFTDLATAVREHEALVRPYLMKAVAADEHRLTALHAALWNGGVFLYVPKNVAVDIPLYALFAAESAANPLVPHVLIVAEEGSSVSYVEQYQGASADGEQVVPTVAEVYAAAGAQVRFASIHNLGSSVIDAAYRRADLAKDARVEWVIGEMNAGGTISDTTSRLNGSGSSADAKVICVGNGEQRMNLTTRNVHIGKATESDMSTRAVMRESSTAIINGITKIEKGATGANGQQAEKVLMLSPTARGDANPILLIDEDDVKAGHAASVGQVNPEQIFYLMSRGLTKQEAERLVIYGFLAPVVAEIPIPELEKQFRLLVERKLGQ